jgi:ribosomal protein L37AE/L43A
MFDEIFFGEINGQNIYDYDEDSFGEDDSCCYGPTRPRFNSKVWKCGDGKTINIKDMTDKHLENTIKYCERVSPDTRILPYLVEERRSRTINEKMKRFETACQFCEDTMKIQELETDIDVGWSLPEYALVCSCGAMGPRMKHKEIFK